MSNHILHIPSESLWDLPQNRGWESYHISMPFCINMITLNHKMAKPTTCCTPYSLQRKGTTSVCLHLKSFPIVFWPSTLSTFSTYISYIQRNAAATMLLTRGIQKIGRISTQSIHLILCRRTTLIQILFMKKNHSCTKQSLANFEISAHVLANTCTRIQERMRRSRWLWGSEWNKQQAAMGCFHFWLAQNNVFPEEAACFHGGRHCYILAGKLLQWLILQQKRYLIAKLWYNFFNSVNAIYLKVWISV